MKIPKLKKKKIKGFLKKLPKILGLHAFLTFLALLLFSLIGAGIIFYRYSILVEKTELDVSESLLQFKEKTYQEVLKTWQEKEKKSREADLKQYLDPFQEIREEGLEPSPIPSQETEEEKEEEIMPEESPTDKIKELRAATNLDEFYMIKEGKLAPLNDRAKLWEEKGLGLAKEYIGSHYQNLKLLEELKKELTE